MANPKKLRTPEEIQAEINRLIAEQKKLEAEAVEARRDNIAEAVRKAGADAEEKYKQYIAKRQIVADRNQKIAKLQTEVNEALSYLKDQYKGIRDTLVGAGAKEEYIAEFIGEPPAVKVAKAAGTTGEKRRTEAKLPDGTRKSWMEMLEDKKIAHKDGNSAYREWKAAAATRTDLPKVERVFVGTDELAPEE